MCKLREKEEEKGLVRRLEKGVSYPRTHSVRALLELGMLEDAYITSRYVMRISLRVKWRS